MTHFLFLSVPAELPDSSERSFDEEKKKKLSDVL
jgi:hypothetical protein